jgi:hypothetical protein
MSDLVTIATQYKLRSRTNYQLKHFVIGQYDTPETRFRQIILESKHLLIAIKKDELEAQILRLKIEKLEASRKEKNRLRAAILKIDLGLLLDTIESNCAELNYLMELSRDYRHYSPEEIEANQEQYWTRRLARQAETDRLATEQNIGVGNLEALMNIGLIQKELVK